MTRRRTGRIRRTAPADQAAPGAVDWALLISSLRRHRDPIGVHDLARELGTGDDAMIALRRQLELLEREGAARCVRGSRWSLHRRVRLVVGRLVCPRRHYGFVTPEDGSGPDVFVTSRRMGDAAHGDRVLLRLIDSSRSREGVEGEVLAILEARSRRVIGVFRGDGRGGGFVEPIDPRSEPAMIGRRAAGAPLPDEGEVVQVEISRPGPERSGTIAQVLGSIEDPAVQERLVSETHALPGAFPPEAVRESEAGPEGIPDAERATREDFTTQGAVTIDPEDAKDHDDAVHVAPIGEGRPGYRLSVHIADVAWSVAAGSALDLEARQRGVSVYLPGKCIPMLPPALSSDRCSLLPGRERLTQSVVMEFDPAGAMIGSRIADGIVRSSARLTYDEAQSMLDARAQGPVAAMLRDLAALASLLKDARMKRGALDLDVPETRIRVDASGRPTDVEIAVSHPSHGMIEESMLAANFVIAEHMEQRCRQGLFRVHEDPDPREIEALEEALHQLGSPPPQGRGRALGRLRALREHYRGRPEEPMVSLLILRALKLARYSSEPGTHFGLAARVYTHFTSPIRRYPDLVVHRIVRASRRGAADRADAGQDLWRVALQSSLLERRAEAAERMMVAIKTALWMKPRIGTECHGVVVGWAPCVVRLEGTGIEGLVRDAAVAQRRGPQRRRSLPRSRPETRLTPGETVRVRVAGVDVPRGKVFLRTLATG